MAAAVAATQDKSASVVDDVLERIDIPGIDLTQDGLLRPLHLYLGGTPLTVRPRFSCALKAYHIGLLNGNNTDNSNNNIDTINNNSIIILMVMIIVILGIVLLLIVAIIMVVRVGTMRFGLKSKLFVEGRATFDTDGGLRVNVSAKAI